MSNPFAESVEDAYNPFAPGAGFEGYSSPTPSQPEPEPKAAPTPSYASGDPEPAYTSTDNTYQPYSAPDEGGYKPYTPPADDGGYQPYTPAGGSTAPPAKGKPDVKAEYNTLKESVGLNANPFKAAKGSDGTTYKDPVTGISVSEADLARREAELARREADIAAKETAVANGTYKKPQTRKNFPPIIRMWEYYPNEDLPASSVKIVQIFKWIYLAVVLDLFVNMLCCLFTLSPGAANRVDSPATMLVLGILYFVVFSPLSFELSFFVLYRALRDGKALRFFCGLATYVIWGAFLIFLVIGVDSTGACGFITMINLFTAEKDKWVGGIAMIFCIVGTLTAVAMVFNFLMFCRYYKKEGLTRKALAEGATMAAQYAKDHPDEAKEVATAAYQAGAI